MQHIMRHSEAPKATRTIEEVLERQEGRRSKEVSLLLLFCFILAWFVLVSVCLLACLLCFIFFD